MPRYTFVITKNAAKDISKLDEAIKKRIKSKLAFFIAQEDPLAFSKTLAGQRYGDYRWRIGDYRVIFDVDGTKLIILQVQHRKSIYKK